MRAIVTLIAMLMNTVISFKMPIPMSDKNCNDVLKTLQRQRLYHHCNDDLAYQQEESTITMNTSRRNAIFLAGIMTFANLDLARAAPPIAIIAEELGYFPVTNRDGEVRYVPKRVQRDSSDQAIQLAQFMKRKKITMYGAYWCPHCARMKELFGKQAWDLVPYVECSSKGWEFKKTCPSDVDGFPTFKSGQTVVLSGEAPLETLAQAIKYPSRFQNELEENLPPPLGSSKCQ